MAQCMHKDCDRDAVEAVKMYLVDDPYTNEVWDNADRVHDALLCQEHYDIMRLMPYEGQYEGRFSVE